MTLSGACGCSPCDPQWRVREAACRALGRRPARDVVLAALTSAQDDPNARVIATAERAGDRLRASESLEIW